MTVDEPAPEGRRGVRQRRLGLAAAALLAVVAVVVGVLVLRDRHAESGADNTGRPVAASALVGPDWRLVRASSATGAAVTIVSPAELRFGVDGSLQGTDACNHLGGPVTVHASTVDVGDLASTAMGCIDRPTGFDLEVALIHAVVGGTVAWSVSGDELTLTKDRVGTLVYRAKADTTTTDPKALTGPIWQLSTLAEPGANGAASSPAAAAWVQFGSDGALTGDDGCNSMSGTSTIGVGRLDSVTYGGTLKLCTSGVERQTDLLRKVLSGSSTWRITDGQLTITKDGAGSLVFGARTASDLPTSVTDPPPATNTAPRTATSTEAPPAKDTGPPTY